jgi:hypothetical protein
VNARFLKWPVYLITGFLFLLFVWVEAGNLEQHRIENRIRHYFGLAQQAPLTETNIESALSVQFPVGTPATTVENSLSARGLNKDDHSRMWQTNGSLCCAPNDYSDGFISMRRFQVSFSLDDQKKVKTVDVSSFRYSL